MLGKGGYFRLIEEHGYDANKSYFEYKKDAMSETQEASSLDASKELSIDSIDLSEVLSTEIQEHPFDLNYNNLFLIVSNLNSQLEFKFLDVNAKIFDGSEIETSLYSLSGDVLKSYSKKTNLSALLQLDMAMQNFADLMTSLGAEETDVFEVNPYLFFMNMFDVKAAEQTKSSKNESLQEDVKPEVQEAQNDEQNPVLPEEISCIIRQKPNDYQNQIDSAELPNEIYEGAEFGKGEYDPVWGNMDDEPYDEGEADMQSLRDALPIDEEPLDGNHPTETDVFDGQTFYIKQLSPEEALSLFDVGLMDEPTDGDVKYDDEEFDPNNIAEGQFGDK